MNERIKKRTEKNPGDSALVEKHCILERRIMELKSIFSKEKEQFLDEDLKARGLK